jgi:hypothetical protein
MHTHRRVPSGVIASDTGTAVVEAAEEAESVMVLFVEEEAEADVCIIIFPNTYLRIGLASESTRYIATLPSSAPTATSRCEGCAATQRSPGSGVAGAGAGMYGSGNVEVADAHTGVKGVDAASTERSTGYTGSTVRNRTLPPAEAETSAGWGAPGPMTGTAATTAAAWWGMEAMGAERRRAAATTWRRPSEPPQRRWPARWRQRQGQVEAEVEVEV